ncbi:MAG: hypothetical protein H6Q50_897 [Deltaproteobacteria bacterium]|nr:hypothetical protein [Deltaproteobacteria bacterium]
MIEQFPIDGGKLLVDLFPLRFVAAPVLLEILLVALEGDFSLVDLVIEDQDFLLDPAISLLERFDLRDLLVLTSSRRALALRSFSWPCFNSDSFSL